MCKDHPQSITTLWVSMDESEKTHDSCLLWISKWNPGHVTRWALTFSPRNDFDYFPPWNNRKTWQSPGMLNLWRRIPAGIIFTGVEASRAHSRMPVWKAWPFLTRSWCGKKNISQGRGRKWKKTGAAGAALWRPCPSRGGILAAPVQGRHMLILAHTFCCELRCVNR